MRSGEDTTAETVHHGAPARPRGHSFRPGEDRRPETLAESLSLTPTDGEILRVLDEPQPLSDPAPSAPPDVAPAGHTVIRTRALSLSPGDTVGAATPIVATASVAPPLQAPLPADAVVSPPEVPPAAAVGPVEEDFLEDLVTASFQSSMVVLGTKMVTAIGFAHLLGVPLRSQWAFGFIPYAGLATDSGSFRHITTLSTIAVGTVSVLWLFVHLARQRRFSHLHTFGVFLTIPMVVLLASLEFLRRIDTQPLLSGWWLLRLFFGAAAAAAIFVGFYLPASERPIVQQYRSETPHQQRSPRRPVLKEYTQK